MRKRITPAMIVALIALFVALAGTATAAGTAVLITGKQIKDGSVGLADMSPKTKAALKGPRGPRGYTGYTGNTGPIGSPGAPGAQGVAGGFDPAKISYVTGPTYTFQPGDFGFAEAECPEGTKLIGGGYFANIMHVAGDKTYGDGRTWSVLINNDTGIAIDANAHAICVAP